MPKSKAQVYLRFALNYHFPFFLLLYFKGASGYKGVEAKMGFAKSGTSDNKHIQIIPSQRATEEVKGR